MHLVNEINSIHIYYYIIDSLEDNNTNYVLKESLLYCERAHKHT